MRERTVLILKDIAALKEAIKQKPKNKKKLKQEFVNKFNLTKASYNYYYHYEKYRSKDSLHYQDLIKYKEKYRNDPIMRLKARISAFTRKRNTFTPQDIINKFGWETKCYLTGQKINLKNHKEYSFDHMIPISRGGSLDFDNLGITTPQINIAKHASTPEEFIALCKSVVKMNKNISNNHISEPESVK